MTRTSLPTPLRALAVLAAATLALLPGALLSPASAHAALETSSPADGSTLTAVPPEVMLRFNEDIGAEFATITVKKGSETASTGKPEVDGKTVYQPIDPSMAQGDWTVTYRVVSEDGHPVSGSFDFTYDTSSGAGSTPQDTSSDGGSSSSTSGSASSSESSGDGTASGSETSGESEASSTSPSDGETPGSDASSSSSAADTEADDASASDDGGIPWWAWVFAALVLLGIGLGVWRAVSGRSDEDSEQIDLERYEG